MPRNILISKDGKHLVSILDCEMAGYYPDFYEFFKYLHEFKECVYAPSTLSLRRGLISFVHCLWIVLRSTRMQYMMSTMDSSTNRKLNRLIRKPSHSNLLLLAIIIHIWERTLENATSQYMTSCHNFYVSRCSSQATDVSPLTKYLAHYKEASEIY